ncbi:hypothetical protein, partial [Propionibacterium freudenreichii]
DTTDITATWFFDMPEPVTYVPTQVSPITCHLCADPTHGVIPAQLPTQRSDGGGTSLIGP